MIELLEKNLKIKAKKKFLEMQKGEVIKTYANISKAKKFLNFNPKTSIEEGIFKFIKWFKESYL